MRLGAIERAVDFNMVADTPSKPVDLTGSRLSRSSVICSSVHSIDAGQLWIKASQILKRRKALIEAIVKVAIQEVCFATVRSDRSIVIPKSWNCGILFC